MTENGPLAGRVEVLIIINIIRILRNINALGNTIVLHSGIDNDLGGPFHVTFLKKMYIPIMN